MEVWHMASNIDAGVGQHATLTNPTGKAGSVSQNPLTPVQYGKNSTASAYTTVTSSDPLVPELVVGPIATGTLVGTASTKGDGTETGIATTGGAGSGATVTYTVASNVAQVWLSSMAVAVTWLVTAWLLLVTLASHLLSQPLVNYGYCYPILCR